MTLAAIGQRAAYTGAMNRGLAFHVFLAQNKIAPNVVFERLTPEHFADWFYDDMALLGKTETTPATFRAWLAGRFNRAPLAAGVERTELNRVWYSVPRLMAVCGFTVEQMLAEL